LALVKQPEMKDTRKPEGQRTPLPDDKQLDGGPDLDTTNLDGPRGYESHAQSLVGEDRGEHGPEDSMTDPIDLSAPNDPTGDDPFVPGTGEARDDFDPDSLLSSKEKHNRQVVHAQDPKGDKGPTYEVHQGTAPQQLGGSTDPNSRLTEETSGLQEDK
jgi:hypothetical protein